MENPILPRRGILLPVAIAAALLFGLVGELALSGLPQLFVIHLGLVVLIGLAVAGTALRARRPGPEALGWKLLTASLCINGCVQAARLPIFLGYAFPPLARDISISLQVVGSLLPMGTLLTWNLAPRTRFDRIRHGLDGLLFALAVFFILWALVLGPAFLGDRFPLRDRLLWLGTFLVYDLLLGLAIYFGLAEPSRFRGPLGWLALAFFLAGLHNFKWLLDVLSGSPIFHRAAGPFIYAMPLIFLVAARSPRAVDALVDPPGQTTEFVHVLPYLPVIGAAALGIWMLATGTGSGHRLILVWLALGLMGLLLTRQYLALRDFFTLSRHLETRVLERTLALEKAQSLLLRTERMNSMATLGAGLAHDMNNLLCAVQTRVELVLQDLDQDKVPNRKDLLRLQEATGLAATLSGRLMALGRQDPEPPRALDLGAELEAIIPLLQVLLPRNQTLRREGHGGPLPFLGTRGMLEQILVNLVGNARDAMPNGGTVSLRSRAPLPEEGGLGPLLEIEDTGSGIPQALQAQVFQPFFTTKAAGTGTGLGLATVKAMLEKMGGAITFSSRPGQGTTFQIRLPRLPEGA